MKGFKNFIESERTGQRAFMLLWILIIVLSLFLNLRYDIFYGMRYADYGLSDWLINYEGGFVRRGLPGQVLFYLYQLHPFNPKVFFLLATVFSCVVLLAIMVHIFVKKGWSMAILPFSCCFFFIFLATWQRKDSLLLVLAYCLFLIYKRFLRSHSPALWLGFFALSAVMILSHEASFFFSIPILAAYAFAEERKAAPQKNVCHTLVRTLLPFIPTLLVMAAVCLFKGNDQTPALIWQSWSEAFARYPDPGLTAADILRTPGASVEALSWKLIPTIKGHLGVNFFGSLGARTPLTFFVGLLGLIWMFAAFYYMVTRINTVNIGPYPMKANDAPTISNTLLIQFVFMIPMFTVLSCDYGRTIPYWVFTSLMAISCFGALNFAPITKLTNTLQRAMRRPIFKKPLFYAFIAACAPMTMCYSPLETSYQARLIKKLFHLLQSFIS